MGAISLERHRNVHLALALVIRKLRTTPAHALTGISETELRRLYRQIHGTSPSSGAIPSTAHLLTSRRRQAKYSAFLAVYLGFEGPERGGPLDAGVLVQAYDYFVALLGGPDSAEMDLTAAWSLVREYKAGISRIRTCPKCRGRYLETPNADLPLNCPFCLLRARERKAAAPMDPGIVQV